MESGVSGDRVGIQRSGGGGGGGWVLVEARLQGGAPWGFTLQGGLEHGEPLIISKVEEGGKADSLEQPLLVGDEIIVINDVELTGYRQEAIALVKGSYKTLQLIVRREFDPGYVEELGPSPPSLPVLPPPSPPHLSSSTPPPPQQTPSFHHRRSPSGGVQLRIKNRRSEPVSRPHSWHSTKLGASQQESEKDELDTVTSAWHHSYHASASTTDLSSGFDTGISYLRKSPDQYSSRGSMESLDHPQSSQLHSGVQHHHPLGHHAHSGPHPAYSSCHQLSSARSSNSIDHLHSKRDSAYSSFSTSSSIPEYLASTPSFSSERSYSLETVPQRGGESGEMQQADMRYMRTVYDTQQGLSQEHELSSSALLHNIDPRGGGGVRPSQDLQGSVGGGCYRGSNVPASNRHSVGPIWGPAASCSSYESLKGAPAPPRRSDSYAAIRNHERPNSWSSLEHARSLRSLQKGSWHHSSGHLASGAVKGSYSTEGQLHTVIEKSPESSPTIKPRQGGGFPQSPSPPEQSCGDAEPNPQSGRLILPTGVYPVPQPEPHYAQMPSFNHGPVSSGVYPALTKQNCRQQHQELEGIGGRNDGVSEVQRDGSISTTQNGYYNNTTSSPHPQSFYSATASSQLRTPVHGVDRPPREESNFDHYKPYMKAAAGRPETPAGTQRLPNHQGSLSQSLHESHIHTSQEQNQDLHIPHSQSTTGLRPLPSQEHQDSFKLQSTVQSRSMDQTSIHSDQMAFSRLTQEQPTHVPVHPQSQASPSTTLQRSARHLSDSAALQQWDYREQDKDREHPLTRLEIALAEVQRCATPDGVVSTSSHGNNSFGDDSQGPARSLSVLEKVSRFERRERAGKQRSHSTSYVHNKANHLRMSEKGRSPQCGADDLRDMLERSTNGTKARRTMSYRGVSSEHMKYRTPADPSSALQRSRSSFQLEGSKEGDSSKDFPWRQDIQEILGSMQDTSYNRSYRDSLKGAQSKVLQSCLRRRELSSSVSPPPPAVSPPVSSTSSHQPSSVPTEQQSLEKKGPKTKPKPLGIIITPQSSQPVTSPHTPKERHVVSPDIRGASPPALPSVPPVGPPGLNRICGRKRLTADQKKRSYSEPENMNEVGVANTETASLFRRGGETSVADRRKMFELAANRVGGGAPQNATSRPELRQLQHDALTEYVERKRGMKREDGPHRSGPRPHSAYLQPDHSNRTVSSCYSDTFSLSSASSMLSLQDSNADQSFSSVERRVCSTLPPGADFRSMQSNLFYPGRVTTPRPPAHPQPSAPPGSLPESQILRNETQSRQSRSLSEDPDLGHQQQVSERQPSRGLFKQLNGSLQRAGSGRRSGKASSAEDLLERLEERQMSPQHYRSRSSPIMDTLNQDFPPDDVRMFGAFTSQTGHCALTEDRPADVQVSQVSVPAQPSQNSLSTVQPAGPSQSSSYTPITRRERQRNCERQRAHSTSTLAASVGLPCPFSPPGTQDAGGTEWQASERLSLDAITFPGTQRDAVGSTSYSETLVMDRQLTDPPNRKDSRSTAPSPPLPSCSSVRYLSSLRISESSILSSFDQEGPLETPTGLSHEDFDDVFLQNPAPPSPPPPIIETSIVEDFPPLPPPPPPLELDQETGDQTVESPSSEFLNNSSPLSRTSPLPSPPKSPSSFPPPAPSLLPSLKPQPSIITTSTTVENSLRLEYQPLPKREKTSEQLRVELLARQLVLQDPSLTLLLDTWGSKTTVELIGEIFPNSKSHLQHGDSSQLDDRVVIDRDTEDKVDEDKKDLNIRKLELCEALRSSVTALQQEKEALCEEQRQHQALGASIEVLVQEQLKTNERDKYSVFIGDLEKIVNLLLSLCSRLSRIDRSLLALDRAELPQEDASEERDSLHHKRSLLLRQTEDARELKENLDRRQQVVHAILSSYLTEQQLQDYRQFVSAKPSLLIRRRHLDDLIRQGEEQLARLAEGLPAELTEAHGWSRASLFTSPSACSSPLPPLLPPSVIPGPAHSVKSTTVTSL